MSDDEVLEWHHILQVLNHLNANLEENINLSYANGGS